MLKRLPPLLFAGLVPAVLAAQNPLARMADVRRAIVARDTATALALLDTIRNAAPDHPNVFILSAHANGLAGRTAQARADITRLLRLDARYARAALRDTTVSALRSEFGMVDSLVKLAEAQLSPGTAW